MTSSFTSSALALSLGLSALPAWSAEKTFPGAPGVLTLAGKCSKLVVGKLDASKKCQSQLGSVTLADGRVTFLFSAEGKLLGFEGDGKGIKQVGDGKATIPLTLVSTGVPGHMSGQVKVDGSCTFGNPYSGKPITIQCSAKSADSAFSAAFNSNGKPPKAADSKPAADAKPAAEDKKAPAKK